jgi:hypothetical protein
MSLFLRVRFQDQVGDASVGTNNRMPLFSMLDGVANVPLQALNSRRLATIPRIVVSPPYSQIQDLSKFSLSPIRGRTNQLD